MPGRICITCHQVFDMDSTRTERCPDCQRQATMRRQARPSSSSRGYDGEYQRNKPHVIAQARAGRPCIICGRPFQEGQKITVEHITPLRKGGTSKIGNLAPAHAACNTAWNKARLMPDREWRICEICGQDYRSTYGAQRTCGRACGAELQRRNYEARGYGHGNRPMRSLRFPSSRIYVADCAWCGTPFTTRYAQQKYCGYACGNRRLISHVLDRHYGYVQNAMREGPLLAYLIKRDHGRCGICRTPIRAKTGDMRPSIDHIQPRSRGGSDDLANLQLAHLRCNRTKSNRGHGEQLLLIG